MKDYDLEDRRVGTTCTFTGGGSLVPRGRLAFPPVVWGFGVIFVLSISAGYYMAQTSPRTVPLPDGPATSKLTVPSNPGSIHAEPQAPLEAPPAGPPPIPSTSKSVTPTPAPGVRAPFAPAQPARPRPSAALVGATGTLQPAIPERPSRFHVQVGSFDSRAVAVSLLDKVRELGYAATLVEGPPYRVWVGGYLDLTTASRLAANLQAAHFDTTLMPR